MTKWELQNFGGPLILVPVEEADLREEVERCRAADAARIADGQQERFLWAQSAPKRANWRDKHFR